KYTKTIFTDDSYLELYRKQKKHLNTQQLTAFRLLYAWRDKMGRQEDESIGYVLPNHMLLKIAEELPKEPQGITACCNPVPPLVRQQLNEMHLLICQAREMPLLKSECAVGIRRKEPLQNLEKPENVLFGPHDNSHSAQDEKLNNLDQDSGVHLEHPSLFSEVEPWSEQTDQSLLYLRLRASISIFNEPEEDEKGKNLTVAQKKARHIMESFENPFRMYLPAELNSVHISQAAKSDPSSKIYEISNRWKLLSQAQLQAGAKKEPAKQKLQAAPKDPEEEPKIKDAETVSVRQLAAQEHVSPKREAEDQNPATETHKRKKTKTETPQPEELDAAAGTFTPFDYSKSDFRVFAGSSKSKPPRQFNPSIQASGNKKFSGASKSQQPAGTKSMSFTAGKSNRGFRHNWPKR
ncbi:exosome complex component 10-like, partial [Erythrolamprus reginae]|uniref:exosome complex component 10-like n=1 Tax=Erythrolamprus reginae TaxID=121349 RepID=UPI00396C4453